MRKQSDFFKNFNNTFAGQLLAGKIANTDNTMKKTAALIQEDFVGNIIKDKPLNYTKEQLTPVASVSKISPVCFQIYNYSNKKLTLHSTQGVAQLLASISRNRTPESFYKELQERPQLTSFTITASALDNISKTAQQFTEDLGKVSEISYTTSADIKEKYVRLAKAIEDDFSVGKLNYTEKHAKLLELDEAQSKELNAHYTEAEVSTPVINKEASNKTEEVPLPWKIAEIDGEEYMVANELVEKTAASLSYNAVPTSYQVYVMGLDNEDDGNSLVRRLPEAVRAATVPNPKGAGALVIVNNILAKSSKDAVEEVKRYVEVDADSAKQQLNKQPLPPAEVPGEVVTPEMPAPAPAPTLTPELKANLKYLTQEEALSVFAELPNGEVLLKTAVENLLKCAEEYDIAEEKMSPYYDITEREFLNDIAFDPIKHGCAESITNWCDYLRQVPAAVRKDKEIEHGYKRIPKPPRQLPSDNNVIPEAGMNNNDKEI